MHLYAFWAFLGAAALVGAAPKAKRVSKFQFFGVNESGAEFGNGNLPGALGTDYIVSRFLL